MKFDPIKNNFQDKCAAALDIDSAKTGFPFIFIKKHKFPPLGLVAYASGPFALRNFKGT